MEDDSVIRIVVLVTESPWRPRRSSLRTCTTPYSDTSQLSVVMVDTRRCGWWGRVWTPTTKCQEFWNVRSLTFHWEVRKIGSYWKNSVYSPCDRRFDKVKRCFLVVNTIFRVYCVKKDEEGLPEKRTSSLSVSGPSCLLCETSPDR